MHLNAIKNKKKVNLICNNKKKSEKKSDYGMLLYFKSDIIQ